MRKIIPLVILSLILKDIGSTCTKGADNQCTGGENGKTICILQGEECQEKNLCSNIASPSTDSCATGVSSDPKKKCSFTTGANACSETDKECTEIDERASDDICLSVTVTGDNGCKYDNVNKKCVESPKCKTISSASNENECKNIPTSNTVTLKCVLKTNKCDEEEKKCSEITFGGTDSICSKATVSDDKKKCIVENGQCKEAEKDATATTTTPTNNSTKSEEKNGANYAKLSLGLLSLLFF